MKKPNTELLLTGILFVVVALAASLGVAALTERKMRVEQSSEAS
jgi:hypothetical protein